LINSKRLKLRGSESSGSWRSYWLRLSLFFLFSVILALISLPILLGILFSLGLLYAPCTDSGATPADYGYAGEAVTLQAQAGGSFRGYFIPGANGATIIIPPSFASGRSGRLPEAALLARHGYAVFLFESRRCAGMGPVSLGYLEVGEVADALDYLAARPDVDLDRIGIYGFSSAGATAIMAAARFPQLRAVIAEGGYGDFARDTLSHSGDGLVAYFLTLYYETIRVMYRLVIGVDITQLSPVTVIDQIAPRPILLIYGSREISLAGGRAQQSAAGDNAHLWVVEGAGHGDYLTVAPEAYEAQVVTFFDKALRPLKR
jgi:pimeloyl-ACP methyl ester carboxylesterase